MITFETCLYIYIYYIITVRNMNVYTLMTLMTNPHVKKVPCRPGESQKLYIDNLKCGWSGQSQNTFQPQDLLPSTSIISFVQNGSAHSSR